MKWLAMLLSISVLTVLPVVAQTCSDSNTSVLLGSPDPSDPTNQRKLAPTLADSTQHNTGQHLVALGSVPSGQVNAPSNARATCTYTHGSSSQKNCNAQCAVFNQAAETANPLAGITKSDNQDLVGMLPSSHGVADDFTPGLFTGTNTSSSCTAYLGGGVAHCSFLNGNCSLSIQVVGGANPTVTVGNTNGDVVWTKAIALGNTCGEVPDPQNRRTLAGGTGEDPCLGGQTDGGSGSGFTSPGPSADPLCSPIIIDTEGEGFHLTSAANGVMFDISGRGHPVQIAWTDSRFRNAFLSLPGTDGLIHNGSQLFGNFTVQDPSNHKNGFLALAEFDEPDQGGNGDGVIDERDAVFAKLRLWIDENHDGISQAEELHTLDEMGIHSLSLRYFQSGQKDQYGNAFRYKARVNPGKDRDRRDETASGEPGRWAYDVFFVAGK